MTLAKRSSPAGAWALTLSACRPIAVGREPGGANKPERAVRESEVFACERELPAPIGVPGPGE
jgi:hypothetical protein